MAELQRAENRVERMATDIAERAGAEIPPAPPFERQVSRMIRARRGGSEPQVPIQRRWHRRRVFGPLDALRPILVEKAIRGTVGPDVDLAHRADRIVPNELAESPRIFRGLALVAHLCRDLLFARRFGHLAGFPNRM